MRHNLWILLMAVMEHKEIINSIKEWYKGTSQGAKKLFTKSAVTLISKTKINDVENISKYFWSLS